MFEEEVTVEQRKHVGDNNTTLTSNMLGEKDINLIEEKEGCLAISKVNMAAQMEGLTNLTSMSTPTS